MCLLCRSARSSRVVHAAVVDRVVTGARKDGCIVVWLATLGSMTCGGGVGSNSVGVTRAVGVGVGGVCAGAGVGQGLGRRRRGSVWLWGIVDDDDLLWWLSSVEL